MSFSSFPFHDQPSPPRQWLRPPLPPSRFLPRSVGITAGRGEEGEGERRKEGRKREGGIASVSPPPFFLETGGGREGREAPIHASTLKNARQGKRRKEGGGAAVVVAWLRDFARQKKEEKIAPLLFSPSLFSTQTDPAKTPARFFFLPPLSHSREVGSPPLPLTQL